MDFIPQSHLQKFKSCYNKCLKAFFGYKKWQCNCGSVWN